MGSSTDLKKGRKGGQFPWTNEEDRPECGRINRIMVEMSGKEAHSYDHVSLKQWMKERAGNKTALEFHHVTATMNCPINDPSNISAGDNTLMNRAAARAAKRFSLGGCSTPANPVLIRSTSPCARS